MELIDLWPKEFRVRVLGMRALARCGYSESEHPEYSEFQYRHS